MLLIFFCLNHSSIFLFFKNKKYKLNFKTKIIIFYITFCSSTKNNHFVTSVLYESLTRKTMNVHNLFILMHFLHTLDVTSNDIKNIVIFSYA
jgi:hypothetical protein